MLRSTLLWILALLIMLSAAFYQRKTGPTYPVDGAAVIGLSPVHYTFTRSHGGAGDQEVPVVAPDTAVRGTLYYKRYKTADAFSPVQMTRRGDTLVGMLPHQPPAGKLEYYVTLRSVGSSLHTDDNLLHLPSDAGTVVTRFKGDVPVWALLPHVLLMFIAMLVSTRAGIEALSPKGKLRALTLVTTVLMIGGGLIFGPIVQKFAFDAYWTGFPFGTDLTDNKTLIMFIVWFAAAAALLKRGTGPTAPWKRWLVLGAAVVTLAVYLIPHSMMGSELDYKKLDAEQQGTEQPAE